MHNTSNLITICTCLFGSRFAATLTGVGRTFKQGNFIPADFIREKICICYVSYKHKLQARSKATMLYRPAFLRNFSQSSMRRSVSSPGERDRGDFVLAVPHQALLKPPPGPPTALPRRSPPAARHQETQSSFIYSSQSPGNYADSLPGVMRQFSKDLRQCHRTKVFWPTGHAQLVGNHAEQFHVYHTDILVGPVLDLLSQLRASFIKEPLRLISRNPEDGVFPSELYEQHFLKQISTGVSVITVTSIFPPILDAPSVSAGTPTILFMVCVVCLFVDHYAYFSSSPQGLSLVVQITVLIARRPWKNTCAMHGNLMQVRRCCVVISKSSLSSRKTLLRRIPSSVNVCLSTRVWSPSELSSLPIYIRRYRQGHFIVHILRFPEPRRHLILPSCWAACPTLPRRCRQTRPSS